MYKIVGIRIVLVEAITWSDGDRITVVESDMEKTYRNFKEYVKTASTAEKDAILLLSYVVLESLVLSLCASHRHSTEASFTRMTLMEWVD